jgi:DNA-binding transcriptional regulator/RsmH inhibitor MraZ
MIKGWKINKMNYKGRISLPKEFSKEKIYFLIQDSPNLLIYPKSFYNSLDEVYLKKPINNSERKKHFSGIEAKLDKNRRILIPQLIRKNLIFESGHYNLQGNGDHIIMSKV